MTDHDRHRHRRRSMRPRAPPRRDPRRAARELPGLPAHPEHLGPARARRRRARAPPSGWPTALTRGRRRARRGRRDRRPPGRLRRLAPRRRRPDRPRLRPLRRPAGRPARPVDVAAVRAGRRRTAGCSPAARPTTRARSTPTSMAAAAMLATARRASRSTCKYVFEGEEESSLDPPRRAGWQANRERLAADVAIISDTGFFEGNLPGHHGQPARPDVRPDRRRRLARRPPLGRLRRRRPEPGRSPSPRSSPRSRARTAGSASRASTTRSSP